MTDRFPQIRSQREIDRERLTPGRVAVLALIVFLAVTVADAAFRTLMWMVWEYGA